MDPAFWYGLLGMMLQLSSRAKRRGGERWHGSSRSGDTLCEHRPVDHLIDYDSLGMDLLKIFEDIESCQTSIL